MTALITLEHLSENRSRSTAIARHRRAKAAQTQRQMGFHKGWRPVVDQREACASKL